MKTTTKEYIERLSAEAKLTSGRPSNAFLLEIAQRLRELDKPDCVMKASPIRLGCIDTGCGSLIPQLHKFKFCPNCGGAVKEQP